MKFIHIADVHLGAVPDSNMPWAKERHDEIWESFKYILNVCNEEKADLLLIAGDLFHKQPLVRELKEVNYLFSALETTRVVMMTGNHDYMGPRSNYRDFKWNEKVHMFSSDRLEAADFPDINTTVYGLSYMTRDITEPLYDDMDITAVPVTIVRTDAAPNHEGTVMGTYTDIYKETDTETEIEADIDTDTVTGINAGTVRTAGAGRIKILLAHGGDERNIPINRKKLLGHGFDYVALGHIHKPEIISDRMAYSGSLEPIDKNETGPRGYIIGEIHEGDSNRTEIKFVSCCHREYKTVVIDINQDTTNNALADAVKGEIRRQGAQHIYQVIIRGFRDENIHFNKEAIYPLGNILEVTDESVPDYDFDALLRENADNIIGMFIKRINESAGRDEINKKALYYGIEALLGAKEQ